MAIQRSHRQLLRRLREQAFQTRGLLRTKPKNAASAGVAHSSCSCCPRGCPVLSLGLPLLCLRACHPVLFFSCLRENLPQLFFANAAKKFPPAAYFSCNGNDHLLLPPLFCRCSRQRSRTLQDSISILHIVRVLFTAEVKDTSGFDLATSFLHSRVRWALCRSLGAKNVGKSMISISCKELRQK